ncbi:hypothetical protein BFG04_03780 [Campylobacter pinnipediorum subsp. pinnipediorum]|uniref:Bacteriophage CI repressor n=1 Tax=Campylobacter pinnipediorum subsp. pinnipediorum TaxID=1660067 RepID=A0AAX0L9J0_9BACT|nr:hypothetical protein [Campylobacter pinnipediorum]OPA77225.1 hypothetical protein BFG04_03780 [Campylobacter pinnipediorum subsp. pinnipediorum]
MSNNIDDDFKKLYAYYGVENDNQLSLKLGYKSNSAISNWRKENKIPDKYSFIISTNIGNNNISISGNDNKIATTDNYSDKFKEFLNLYEKYGNDAVLESFIKKLKTIKEISED